jgi:hypothetical protein
VDEAGVLAGPSEAGGGGKGALNDWAGVDVGAGFEGAALLAESGFKSQETLL